MDGALIESIMAFVAVFSLSSWIPQIARILLICNGSWLLYAFYIDSISFLIQQTLTVVMLLWFGSLIIKYRTTPLFFKRKVSP